jgi:PAS domain S-box-containing protein
MASEEASALQVAASSPERLCPLIVCRKTGFDPPSEPPAPQKLTLSALLAETDFRHMFSFLPVGICYVDPDRVEIVLANESAASILALPSAQDLVGQSVFRFVPLDRRPQVEAYLRAVAEQAPSSRFFPEPLRSASGQPIELEIAVALLHLGGHSVIQLVFQEITDRARAEAALRESEGLFRSLSETTDAAIFLFRGSRNVHVNAAACRITGYSYQELVAMPFWQVLHPDFRELVQARGLARQEGEDIPTSYKVAIVTKGGEVRWLQYSGNVIDYQGQLAVLGTAYDVTPLVEAEQALRAYARRLETLSQIDRLGLMGLSRREIASAALDHIRMLIQCDRASIVEIESATKSCVMLAVSPASATAIPPGRRFKLSRWQMVHDGLRDDVQYVSDIDALPALSLLQQEVRAEGIRSYIAVPLLAQQKLVGVLNLGSFAPQAFDWSQRSAAQEVAQRLAVVLYNAHLFGALATSRQRQEELSRRLERLQEAERQAIARELHDEFGQTLTALSIHLQLAMLGDADRQARHLADTQRLVEDLAVRVRRMSLDLRPPMLDDLGLLPTLLWYFDRIAQQHQLQVTFRAARHRAAFRHGDRVRGLSHRSGGADQCRTTRPDQRRVGASLVRCLHPQRTDRGQGPGLRPGPGAQVGAAAAACAACRSGRICWAASWRSNRLLAPARV